VPDDSVEGALTGVSPVPGAVDELDLCPARHAAGPKLSSDSAHYVGGVLYTQCHHRGQLQGQDSPCHGRIYDVSHANAHYMKFMTAFSIEPQCMLA
jgi:hypothetical protein